MWSSPFICIYELFAIITFGRLFVLPVVWLKVIDIGFVDVHFPSLIFVVRQWITVIACHLFEMLIY
jgi:hypothetical protein